MMYLRTTSRGPSADASACLPVAEQAGHDQQGGMDSVFQPAMRLASHQDARQNANNGEREDDGWHSSWAYNNYSWDAQKMVRLHLTHALYLLRFLADGWRLLLYLKGLPMSLGGIPSTGMTVPASWGTNKRGLVPTLKVMGHSE